MLSLEMDASVQSSYRSVDCTPQSTDCTAQSSTPMPLTIRLQQKGACNIRLKVVFDRELDLPEILGHIQAVLTKLSATQK